MKGKLRVDVSPLLVTSFMASLFYRFIGNTVPNYCTDFPWHLFTENVCGKRGKWHFRDPKFKNFLWELDCKTVRIFAYNQVRASSQTKTLLKRCFPCVHRQNVTLCPCEEGQGKNSGHCEDSSQFHFCWWISTLITHSFLPVRSHQ